MERFIWVRHARAKFADAINTAAYASDRIVIIRRGEEVCALVGLADLNFLRRHLPLSRYPERAAPAQDSPGSATEPLAGADGRQAARHGGRTTDAADALRRVAHAPPEPTEET